MMSTTFERQALLDECLPFLRRLAAHWGRVSQLYDTEDLYHEAVCSVLTTMDKLPADIREPRNYLVKVARYDVLNALSGARPDEHLSLEAPSHEGTNITLLDILASEPAQSPAPGCDYAPLYTAVKKLTLAQQKELERFYSLPLDVQPTRPARYSGRKFHKKATLHVLASRRRRAIAQLRQDEELRQAVSA